MARARRGRTAHLDDCIVPEKARLERLLRAYKPDLCLCFGYPWLLPPEVLAVPPLGVLNGHPSLLPRWRGPFPVGWAIREGDAELAMTFQRADRADVSRRPRRRRSILECADDPLWVLESESVEPAD